MNDSSTRNTLVFGFFLLAFSLPLGLTLEALHAFKVDVYLGSATRREMWTLAHAHGNVLGILLVAWAAVAERWLADERARRTASRWLRAGAVTLPAGFLAGGVLNYEGDPSLGIVLVPIGGACLLVGLLRAGLAARAGS